MKSPDALAYSQQKQLLGESQNLDFLRAVAVLSVVINHVPYLKVLIPEQYLNDIGRGGVLIFFVHTTLVLMLSLQRTRTAHPFASFYLRRAFRIFPLAWLCIALVLLTGITDVPRADLGEMGPGLVLANVALVQNVVHVPSILGPLWSLPWEVQMYLVLPGVFRILGKFGHPLAGVLLWCAPVFLRWLAPLLDARFANIGVIFPSFFLGGAVAYQLRQRISPRIPAALWPFTLFMIIGGRCALLRGDAFYSLHNATINACTCLLLGLVIPLFRELRVGYLTAPAKMIAKYSYGIYLFHVPAIQFALRYQDRLPAIAMLTLSIVILIPATVAAYHLLEEPAIECGKSLAKRWFPSANEDSHCVRRQGGCL